MSPRQEAEQQSADQLLSETGGIRSGEDGLEYQIRLRDEWSTRSDLGCPVG